MKIRMIKDHPNYVPGEHEVSSERGNYLIDIGAAEDPTNPSKSSPEDLEAFDKRLKDIKSDFIKKKSQPAKKTRKKRTSKKKRE